MCIVQSVCKTEGLVHHGIGCKRLIMFHPLSQQGQMPFCLGVLVREHVEVSAYNAPICIMHRCTELEALHEICVFCPPAKSVLEHAVVLFHCTSNRLALSEGIKSRVLCIGTHIRKKCMAIYRWRTHRQQRFWMKERLRYICPKSRRCLLVCRR